MTNTPNPDEIPPVLRDVVARWRRVTSDLPSGIADRILSDARYAVLLDELADLVATVRGAAIAPAADTKLRVERVALEEAVETATRVVDDLIPVDDDRTLDEILEDAAVELSDRDGIVLLDGTVVTTFHGRQSPAAELSDEERATVDRIEAAPAATYDDVPGQRGPVE